MAITYLDAVNKVLRLSKKIQGEQDDLTSFTDASIQPEIDAVKELWNHLLNYIQSVPGPEFPSGSAETTITLATNDRSYALPTDLEQINWPLIETTNGYTIHEYPGGYERLRTDQLIPTQWTGRPEYAAINPTTGELYFDRLPTANENGDQYTLYYDKSFALSATTDTFPFTDAQVQALVFPVTEMYKRYYQKKFDPVFFAPQLGQAMRMISRSEQSNRW